MPEQFAEDWLRLREAADHAARPASLVSSLNAALPAHRPLRVLDLGAGAGSNLRYLAPRLGGAQHWTLVDHDRALLERATTALPEALGKASLTVETRIEGLERLLDQPLPDADVVTASALIDLVSRDWLDTLARRCAEQRVPVLIALSIDGRVDFADALPDDAWIQAVIMAHQRGVKDMGPALGPDAPHAATEAFEAAGYRVRLKSSDWCLGPNEPALQRALVDGWYAAAHAHAPEERPRLETWYTERLKRLPDRQLRVGHQDMLALP